MKGERLGEFEELILLCVCRLGKQATGVSIQAALQEDAKRRVTLGAIYAALDRMTRKGFVESWIGKPTPERGGRAKRHYGATAVGRSELRHLHDVRGRLWKRARLSESRQRP